MLHKFKRPQFLIALAIVFVAVGLVAVEESSAQLPEETASVEGITEYKLANGVKLLLFPDDSKPQFTLNMTVLVGSRHEGYGEAGMAHLLEHMLFRGTDRHQDIPKLLKDRGVLNMNGTTSIDRTNYFETLPASDENLEFAIGMEADRLINSWIRPDHLAKEMTIVRSEFERGENSPRAILFQRIMTSAYQWHNYGKSTIGNESDIMRVPASNLRVFYQKYYQPDNITLVIAGKFNQQKALELVNKYFGSIPRPERKLPTTYTEEPEQDGERLVVLRRRGDIQLVGLGYHVPSSSSEEYAAVQVLASILSNRPDGPLYKTLVETKKATLAAAFPRVGYDPGLMMVLAEVPKENDLLEVKDLLVEVIENAGSSADNISDKDVERAVRGILKRRERSFANTESFATSLSEWESYGDWRLYFLHRDRLEEVTTEQVREVAKKYLIESNRTVGLFYPTDETPMRASIEARNRVNEMVANYKGREKIAEGEAFDPSPLNIQQRTTFGTLDLGAKYALLPKETRGDRVTLQAAIHYGTADSLKGKVEAATMLPSLMTRGTKDLSFQDYNDKLDELKATLSIGGSTGVISVSLSTERDNLVAALDVMKQALREPSLDAKQFDILKERIVTSIESGLSDPQQLAMTEFSRRMSPYPNDDVRYTPTIEEDLERYKAVTLDDVKALYDEFIGGQHAEIAVVGDFEQDAVLEKLRDVFAGWKSDQDYVRIDSPANLDLKSERIDINTPDKKNAFYIAGVMTDIGEQHSDYEAMLIGNYIMGGGPLSSRIADRVRKQDGLSYTAMTSFRGASEDDRGTYMILCISNPMNTEKVASTVKEEVVRMTQDGVTAEELATAKESYLTNRKGGRARDSRIASELVKNLRTGRTMDFQQASDEKISTLTKDQVDAALKRVNDPEKMIIITAGDFDKKD